MTHANVGSLLVFDTSKIDPAHHAPGAVVTSAAKEAVMGIITERGAPRPQRRRRRWLALHRCTRELRTPCRTRAPTLAHAPCLPHAALPPPHPHPLLQTT